MLKVRYIVVFWALILSPTTFVHADRQAEPLAVLPIEIVDNRTHLLIDGPDGPARFLLDTGATSSVFFDPTFIAEGTLDGAKSAKLNFPAIGRAVQAQRLSTVTLRAGASMIESEGGLLLPPDSGIGEALDADFAGIIGQELFKRYVVEIDPLHSVARLYSPATDLEADYELEHSLRMVNRAPYITFRSQLPWEKSATKKDMLLDTGYPGGMVFWSETHFMKAAGAAERRELVQNDMGILTAANVTFGELYFKNLPVFISSHVPEQTQGRDGLIGASILAQYKHVIDFHHERLLLSPVVDDDGNPIQIIDGAVYTPNNEDFVVKFFTPRIPVYPVMTLYSIKSKNFSGNRLQNTGSRLQNK